MEQLSERKYGRNIGLRFKLDLLFARNAATPKTRLGAGRDQMPTSGGVVAVRRSHAERCAVVGGRGEGCGSDEQMRGEDFHGQSSIDP